MRAARIRQRKSLIVFDLCARPLQQTMSRRGTEGAVKLVWRRPIARCNKR